MYEDPSKSEETPAWGTLLRVVVAGVGGGLVFVTLLGYRTDYAGHFLAGFGGTLGLLAVALVSLEPPRAGVPFALAMVAIVLGAVLEATVFKIAIFDPVDFCNQSLGAVLAAAAVQHRGSSLVAAVGVGVLALVFLTIGFRLAFA